MQTVRRLRGFSTESGDWYRRRRSLQLLSLSRFAHFERAPESALISSARTCDFSESKPLYKKFGKRAFDLALAGPALLILAPVIALTALAVRLRMGPGVLFCQERPGLNGQSFMLYKFRTMLNTRNAAGELLPDAERLPSFGIFLRRSSLDELPQLWNVVRGDMSLIGPRPLMMRYLGRYSPEQFRRHEMLPGITGWAQVNGRNEISWERKFELDVWYVDHVSFLLDARIFWMTLLKLVSRQGVSAEGHATAPEFEGQEALQIRNEAAEDLPAGVPRGSSR